jgi:hypothetical protein
MTQLAACSVTRCFNTTRVAPKKHFGGISDNDRIFQNIYGRHDTSIKVWAACTSCGDVQLHQQTNNGCLVQHAL